MKKAMLLLLTLCWLSNLTACSLKEPVAVTPVLPVMPAYPARPEITWQGTAAGVALGFDDALQLRDWLVNEDAWRESVTEIWTILNP
ncbi:MAG: hypothetical protein LBJ14_11135 [Desulfarculales bacterium]|jgi:hypothetical protein|nr:hypothetical protein [Desulfarculales bacterium]